MKMMMKSVIAGAALSVAAVAAPGSANALVCPSETPATGGLTPYLAMGFTCTIGDKTFSNFMYTPDGSATPPATESTPAAGTFTVTPDNPLNGFGFTFGALWNATNGGSADSDLRYQVAVIGGAALITDTALQIAAVATGPGSTAFTRETVETLGGALLASLTATDTLLNPPPMTFAAQSAVMIDKDIGAMAGPGGTAQVSSVTNAVSQTPEPPSLAILAVSLLGMGVAFRRYRRR
jgi:hypothetical protein